MSPTQKHAAFAALRARLRADLEAVEASQVATQAGAVHEESRAEDPKDTRATEASYLARGLAERAEALRDATAVLEGFAPPERDSKGPIAVGALVEIEALDGVVSRYLLAPVGGGTKLVVDEFDVVVLTPSAPLGRALIGRAEGDEIEVPARGGARATTITRVS